MLRSALGVLLLALMAGCAVTPAEFRYAEPSPYNTIDCVTTGSHIVSNDCRLLGRSLSAAGSGALSTAAALRMLYPTVIVYQPQ